MIESVKMISARDACASEYEEKHGKKWETPLTQGLMLASANFPVLMNRAKIIYYVRYSSRRPEL